MIEPMAGIDAMRAILDQARWAPSGDNTQPWRFEIVSPSHVVVHGHDTRDHCVYDLDGRPSQMSLGALLETLRVAASMHALRADVRRREDLPDTTPTFDVRLVPDPEVTASPLAAVIEKRSVQRRPLSTRPLCAAEKAALEQAVGPAYEIVWIEGFAGRFAAARLMFRNAKIRLTLREAWEVHRSIIDWGRRFSEDKVPDQALGADAVTLQLMRFVLGSWERVRFFNRFLAGTWGPRLQMDLLPGIACAAHFALRARRVPVTVDDWVDAGRAVQRFWLTCTWLGLQKQPELTPLVFARYVADGVRFTAQPEGIELARGLVDRLVRLVGHPPGELVWMGRVGHGPMALSRSLRLPLERLGVPGPPVDGR